MTIEKTIKKAEKLSGQKIQIDSVKQHFLTYKGYVISFFCNGHYRPDGEAICFYTRREDLHDDHSTDYFAGTFHDNITQCFKFIDRLTTRN